MSTQKREYYARALAALVPDGFGYAIDDSVENFEDIIWASGTPYVTQSELEAKADELEQLAAANVHQEKRIMHYPSTRDLADAIYWWRKGDETKLDAWVAACDAVKDKFPKGE